MSAQQEPPTSAYATAYLDGYRAGELAGLTHGRASAEAERVDAAKCRLLAKEPTLVGRWRTKNGYLFCGTLRIAAADFDTAPRAEYRDAVLQDLCDAANFVVANYSDDAAFDATRAEK